MMMARITHNVLRLIRELRETEGFSQQIMADKMNITQSAYARFELGNTKTDLDTLEIFCDCVGVSLVEFFMKLGNIDISKKEERVIVSFEVSPDKKEELLAMVVKK